jgi:restriction system protein
VASPPIPQYHKLMWPAITALKELGGSASVRELYERVVEDERFSEEQQAVQHGRTSEIDYRLRWALTHLKGIGAANNSERAVWALTDKGQALTPNQVQAETKAWREALQAKRASGPVTEAAPNELGEGEFQQWADQLIGHLLDLSPGGFERLAQRLLREAGFVNVTVTGKSGDEGIDGVGVYRLSLVSFPVYFQCKRYRGSVRAGTVRDFRGAMAGRGEKGLLITTGTFTKDAQAEATRDGAPPVELIDGERLCDLMKQYGLGVEVKQRTEEDVVVDAEFFREFR